MGGSYSSYYGSAQYYQDEMKKKRYRRQADQIERHYKCPIEGCNKAYGSEGSLNQHTKLKHPEFFNASGNLITGSNYEEGSYDSRQQ